MTVLRACQRTDGRWVFAQCFGTEVYPIGYCRLKARESKPSLVPRYHDDGHATADEAALCYHRYQVEQLLVLVDPPEKPQALYECALMDCLGFTAGYAKCAGWRAWLCDAHRNAAVVDSLMPVATEIIQ